MPKPVELRALLGSHPIVIGLAIAVALAMILDYLNPAKFAPSDRIAQVYSVSDISDLPIALAIPNSWTGSGTEANSTAGVKLNVQWYRIVAPLHEDRGPELASPKTLWLSAVRSEVAVWSDKQWVHIGSRPGKWKPIRRHVGILLPQGETSNAAASEIFVAASSLHHMPAIGQRVWISNQDDLRWPLLANRLFFELVPLLFVGLTLLGAIALAVVWLVRRRDQLFLWLSLATLFRVLFVLESRQDLIWLEAPRFHEVFVYAALSGAALFDLAFSRSLLKLKANLFERTLPTILLLLLGLIALLWELSPSHSALLGVFVVVPIALGCGVMVTARFVQCCPQSPLHRECVWLAVAGTVLVTFGFIDWLYDLGALGSSVRGRYFHYALPPVLAVFLAMLLRRHLIALDAVESVNIDLEKRVLEKGKEIAGVWSRISEFERDHARFSERERLTRDMHDGLGGHLVQVLAMIDAGHGEACVREAAQSALDDLRAMIDANHSTQQPISLSLGRFRERMTARLHSLNIALEWDLTEVPESFRPSESHYLQLLRILQEAFANITKHSDCSRVVVSCISVQDIKGSFVRFSLSDNGRGFDFARCQKGRGLENMQARAQSLGGFFRVDSQPGTGTTVELSIPLQA